MHENSPLKTRLYIYNFVIHFDCYIVNKKKKQQKKISNIKCRKDKFNQCRQRAKCSPFSVNAFFPATILNIKCNGTCD